MNRNYDRNNNQRKNHYADFDEHGNPRTGNTNSLSRHEPENRGRDYGRNHNEYDRRDSHSRMTPDARAYGDYSGGTRYGEGGSTYGGGSAYGDSYYGMSGQQGPRYRDAGHSRSGDERHGYSDRDRDDYSRQNYGRSGGYNYSGRMEDDRSYRGTGYTYGSRPGPGSTYEDRDRESRGYDRGYGGYGRTGYGSTGYDNRDEDRERSAYSNRGYSDENRRDYGYNDDDRRQQERGQSRGLFSPDRRNR